MMMQRPNVRRHVAHEVPSVPLGVHAHYAHQITLASPLTMAFKMRNASVPMKHQNNVVHAMHANTLLTVNVLQNALAPQKIAKLVEPTQESAINFHFCSPSYALSPSAW
jgi:hypothetical protein